MQHIFHKLHFIIGICVIVQSNIINVLPGNILIVLLTGGLLSSHCRHNKEIKGSIRIVRGQMLPTVLQIYSYTLIAILLKYVEIWALSQIFFRENGL